MSNLDKRQRGLGYEYFNVIDLRGENAVFYCGGTIPNFEPCRFGGLFEIEGVTYAVGVRYTEPNVNTEYIYNADIIISRYTPESNSLKFTGTPVVVSGCGAYCNPPDEDDFNSFVEIYELHIPVNAITFAQIIDNNVDIYNLNTMSWDEVDNIVDFGAFILDFLRGVFFLLIDIFKDLGVFFT